MLRNLFTMIIAILVVVSSGVTAQTKETKEKIKELKGKAEKILIVTSEGKLELTGEDAESILKKIKSEHNLKKVWHNKNGHVIHINEDSKGDSEKVYKIKISDDDCNEEKMDIDVDVEELNGTKKIIIKKGKDGEKKVIEWTDDSDGDILKEIDEDVIFIKLDENDKDNVEVIIEKLGEGDTKNITKKIEVNKDGDELKVIETTTENGEESVKEYVGEEAEKFLEKIKKEDKQHMDEFGDVQKHKKFKKIIVKSHCETEGNSKEIKKIKVEKKAKKEKHAEEDEHEDKN
ncbi:MAG: hypothetical protein JEY94_06280 [Melioribacteraceae bacterium]|nr:hypothetical protein [Melioribacteraceae bacterium]